MTTIQAQVPDYLAHAATDAAAKEGTTLDQIVALALSAQLAAWRVREDMETRAQRGSRADLRTFLDAVPSAPPVPGDELP